MSAKREKETRIVAAALRLGTLTLSAPPPARHHTLLHAFHAYNRKALIKPSDQGFLTNGGEFVNREEAWLIAEAAGQIIGEPPVYGKLFSEDLW